MNEMETAAHDWLLKQGCKEILTSGWPDFHTDKGNYEVKRLIVSGRRKLLSFTHGQPTMLLKTDARILVFKNGATEPYFVLVPHQLAEMVSEGHTDIKGERIFLFELANKRERPPSRFIVASHEDLTKLASELEGAGLTVIYNDNETFSAYKDGKIVKKVRVKV